MDSRTVFKIEEEATTIVQRWRDNWDGDAAPYHQTCWIILNNLPGTLEEIAQASDLSDRTVSQVINALERGGVSIQRESVRIEATGRPRTVYSV
jgi:predicted ArsR family transcriptional regulator